MSDSTPANKLFWKAEAQDQAKTEQVREALREVVDPEIGLNIIELGLIRDVEFQPDKTWAQMILTTPFCPYGPALIEQTRKKISEASGQPAQVEMGMELWDPSMMEEGAGADWGLF